MRKFKGDVIFASPFLNRNAAQQINGREGETATLLSAGLFILYLRVIGFAPRHLKRWAAIADLCSDQQIVRLNQPFKNRRKSKCKKIVLSSLHISFGKKLLFLFVFITLLGIGSIAFSTYSKATSESPENNLAVDISPKNKQAAQGCCGASTENTVETQILVGSYYSLKDGQETILMFNNKGPQPLVVNPSSFSLNGERLNLEPFTIPATSYTEVDLRVLLANYLPQFAEGSLQVTH